MILDNLVFVETIGHVLRVSKEYGKRSYNIFLTKKLILIEMNRLNIRNIFYITTITKSLP